MIKDEILEKLITFSKEEIDILNGDIHIDESIYDKERKNSIDVDKLLLPEELISIRKHTRFIDYPEHFHNYFELMYVFNGELRQVINGKEVVLKEGEYALLNKNVSHSILKSSENDVIFNFIIRPEFFDYISNLMDSENEIFNFILESMYSNYIDGKCLLFRVSDNEAIKGIIENIITTLYSHEPSRNVKIKLYVGLLLTEFTNCVDGVELLGGSSYDNVMNIKILEYISKEYNEGSLAKIASRLHQPEYKICRVVKKYTGRTFKQLVQDTRLNCASKLLLTTKMPINEIMNEVGYENITYFYKIFKAKYSLTPNEYRIKYINESAKKDNH